MYRQEITSFFYNEVLCCLKCNKIQSGNRLSGLCCIQLIMEGSFRSYWSFGTSQIITLKLRTGSLFHFTVRLVWCPPLSLACAANEVLGHSLERFSCCGSAYRYSALLAQVKEAYNHLTSVISRPFYSALPRLSCHGY